MKELKMKRLIVLLATLLLSFGLTYAGTASIDLRVPGDTIVPGSPVAIEIWLANDVPCFGFQIPLGLTTPDGVTWTWNAQTLNAWGASKYITHNPAGRIALPTSVAANFDLTSGLLVQEPDLPTGIGFGAGVMFGPGMLAGPLQPEVYAHLTVTNDFPVEEVHQLCFDVNVALAGGVFTWSFIDAASVE